MATTADTMVLKPKSVEGKPESQASVVFRRFRRHKMAMASLIVITIILILSFLAPFITSFERDAVDMEAAQRPGAPIIFTDQGVHWLGIDHLGRDLFTRVLYAGRISLTIAILVVFLSESVGMVLGALAGYYGGLTDSLVSRTIEFMLAIPL